MAGPPTKYCVRCGEQKEITSFGREGHRGAICSQCRQLLKPRKVREVRAELQETQKKLALAIVGQLEVPESREVFHHLYKRLGGAARVGKLLAESIESMVREKPGSKTTHDALRSLMRDTMAFEKKEHEVADMRELTDEDIQREMARIVGLTVVSPEPLQRLEHDQEVRKAE